MQIGEVEGPVVGRTVFAYKSGAVNGEDYMEILQGDIVYDLVKGPLQECGVDGADWFHPFKGLAGRKSDGVPFGNAYIIKTVGDGALEHVKRSAGGHCGSNGGNGRIFQGHFHKGFSEYLLIFWCSGRAIFFFGYSCNGVKPSAVGMPVALVLFSGQEPFPLCGDDMEQFRVGELLHLLERPDKLPHVMTVYRAEVAQPECFKKRSRGEGGFHTIFKSSQRCFGFLCEVIVH